MSTAGKESCSTAFLVLRTTRYREKDLILHGISPDFGKLTLLAYGASGAGSSSGSKNRFPVVGLFRELAVEFCQIPNRDIFPVQELELLNQYDTVAIHPEHCRQLGQMANFLLQHLGEGLPAPLIYDAFLNLLKNAAADQLIWSVPVCSVLFKLVYLYENGLLPEPEEETPNMMQYLEIQENLISSALEFQIIPQNLNDQYFIRLNSYLNQLLKNSL